MVNTLPAALALAFPEPGYPLNAGRVVVLEPFANIAYVNLHTDGFNESGGAAALQCMAIVSRRTTCFRH